MSVAKVRIALESAVDAMPGIIPDATILTSTAGLFVTSAPHNIDNGLTIKIVGHSILNGSYIISVVDTYSFQLINAVSETLVTTNLNGTGGVVRASCTLWENMAFNANVGIAYQQINILFGTPENPSLGDGFYREIGFLQFTLYYPKETGTVDLSNRIDLIRTTFARGSSFTKDEVTVKINKTPIVAFGLNQDSYIMATVKIPFWADIFN